MERGLLPNPHGLPPPQESPRPSSQESPRRPHIPQMMLPDLRRRVRRSWWRRGFDGGWGQASARRAACPLGGLTLGIAMDFFYCRVVL
jgi:hypothetical protein